MRRAQWFFCLLGLLAAAGMEGCGARALAPPGGEAAQVRPGQPQSAPEEAAEPAVKAKDEILEQVQAMSLDEKVGQLLLVGLDGTAADEHARTWIGTYHAGGFILFRDNIQNAAQLLKLAGDLKEANRQQEGVPLWMSLDEEGGRVSRMPEELAKPPSAAAVGRADKPAASLAVGQAVGRELAAFGMNMNFAPVLDVFSNPANTVIGDRAYGRDPALVGRVGIQTMKGLQSQQVTAVVKHFPGHGDTLADSHYGLPVVNHDLERLRSLELKPFAEAIRSGADAVMVAHILLPKLDAEAPASLSRRVITGLLREEMSFGGVVVTDDLVMSAITKRYSLGEAGVKAVEAGADVLLVGHGYEAGTEVFSAVKRALTEGVITGARLDESVARILRLKAKYRLRDERPGAVDTAALNEQLRSAVKQLEAGKAGR
ncbi:MULTISPECIES: beta-N-acetylhexosaminidase [Paenibacillus]|uniref:beta-N-acetylhexosaminidase n=1 Tax=Paenibacillus TaxID=44249 RepID=UPI0022B9222B|nr:beta-N-acetylhexosaminidase [Paenibacillus caseinilyticus]MCZ8522309.1 beta-N-acetylhexosaminidase [Paenibacillus caseinilyticus]